MNFFENTHQVNPTERNNAPEEPCFEHLSIAQQMSASELRQFGFELQSIHGEVFESIAVFTSEPLSVTVDYLGEIGCLAALYFRK